MARGMMAIIAADRVSDSGVVGWEASKPMSGAATRKAIASSRKTIEKVGVSVCAAIGWQFRLGGEGEFPSHFIVSLYSPGPLGTSGGPDVASHRFLNPSTMPAPRGYTHVV